MRPVKRYGANKSRGAANFRRNVGRTRAPNMHIQPMRGGWRL